MPFKLFDLGLEDFQKARDFQEKTFQKVKNNKISGALIFCEHNPVITLGRSAKKENILTSPKELTRLKIKTHQIERGGDVTYHGPGQLCVYPIVNLRNYKKDINLYLRNLEKVIINTLSEFKIKSTRRKGLTGAWVKTKKIASIGIGIKNWITFHGIALNIKKDIISNFSLIRPCGKDIIITSMEEILKEPLEVKRVKEVLTENFKKVFEITGGAQ